MAGSVILKDKAYWHRILVLELRLHSPVTGVEDSRARKEVSDVIHGIWLCR